MAIVKYGGTSVGRPKIINVARRIVRTVSKGHSGSQ